MELRNAIKIDKLKNEQTWTKKNFSIQSNSRKVLTVAVNGKNLIKLLMEN